MIKNQKELKTKLVDFATRIRGATNTPSMADELDGIIKEHFPDA